MNTAETIMDIGKRDSMCSQTPEINFSEQQFSDSSMEKQHTKTANNSPEGEAATFSKTENSPMLLESEIENLGNSNGSSTAALGITSPNSKGVLPQVSMGKVNPNAPTKSIREDKDINISNIKKEDTALSPQNASPIGNNNDDNGNEEGQERSKSVGSVMSANITPNLDTGSTSLNASPKSNVDGFNPSGNMQNIPRNMNPYNGNPKFNFPTQGDGQVPMNASGPGGGGGGEYMQQQNHVFVFSTQLANKSAEAVVGGQFPTIIAYHCMQPSTKMFLEDFLKNPSKSSKMQRQYSLNIMNLMQGGMNRPGPQSSFWLNDCNNAGKVPQRQGALRNVGPVMNKNSPGWDPSLGGLDTKGSSNPLDLLNNTEGFDNAQQLCGIKDEDKSNIPSLQGVKVPDENLTPQQRQHREEQLAKIKKMNKFLFPENDGNEYHSAQPNSSTVPTDGVGSNNPVPMEALHNTSAGGVGNLAGNMGKHPVAGQTNLDGVPNLGEESSVQGETTNIGIMQANKQGCISKMNSNLSSIKSRGGRGDDPINTGIENSPDLASSFNLNNCPQTDAEAARGPPNMNMPHEEWSKFQNNAFGDNFKFRDSNTLSNTGGSLACNAIPVQQNPSIARSHSTGIGGGYGMQSRPNAGPSPTNRNNNGPPPPYHQTQRSASVPISTQSPTQPNHNSNAEMGIPSPHGSRVPFGVDVPNPAASVSNTPHSSAASFVGLPSGNPKNIYSRDGTNLVNTTQMYNAQSATGLNIQSNPPSSHSLAHMSHSEIDSLNSGHKLKRSSPQKSKSPMINEMQGNVSMESKYPNFGMNYGMPPTNAPNMRQNMQQMPPQFCRRIDNIPLNPNCNRVNQNKPVSNFDPIASLAQMSQQLTGSAMGLSSIGGGGGSNTSTGVMDINAGEMMGGPSGRGDHPLDHCNQMSNNNMGMVGLGGRPGQFPSDMNSMDPMDQRMLNGKLCMPPGHFNHNTLTGVGLGVNDMMPSNRAMNRMNRMPGNFDNFNMSSNVHVRASAPNTIQYMPARSQNINNMRMPPSMEFFQRYGSPHGNMGGIGNSGGHLNNDMTNPNMMNIFGNCGPMPGRAGGGFDQNDLGVEGGNLIPNDGYMNGP